MPKETKIKRYYSVRDIILIILTIGIVVWGSILLWQGRALTAKAEGFGAKGQFSASEIPKEPK